MQQQELEATATKLDPSTWFGTNSRGRSSSLATTTTTASWLKAEIDDGQDCAEAASSVCLLKEVEPYYKCSPRVLVASCGQAIYTELELNEEEEDRILSSIELANLEEEAQKIVTCTRVTI